jgi:UDP-N-acetylglucosamine 2-epimerase (non-hydrolysing)
MKPVVVFAGTMPEIIKITPILRALERASLPHVFVHCGQHYDYNRAQPQKKKEILNENCD